MKVSSFTLSSQTQIWLGTWAFIGIPVTIVAGVAALYRIEMPLRAMFFYLTASFFIYIGLPLYLLASGSLCDTVVTPEVQRMGSAFVCGFTDSFVFMWTLIAAVCNLYIVYIVWSAAEEIAKAPYPELMRYSDALRSVQPPNPLSGPHPLSANRAEPVRGSTAVPPQNGTLGTSAAGGGVALPGSGQLGGQRGNAPWDVPTPTVGEPIGTPQSFIPAPQSGVRFS